MVSSVWIQQAVKRPGSLRAYIKRVFGSRGFTSDGTIKVEVLRKLAKSGSPRIRRKASLALTLRKLAKKRSRKKAKKSRRAVSRVAKRAAKRVAAKRAARRVRKAPRRAVRVRRVPRKTARRAVRVRRRKSKR